MISNLFGGAYALSPPDGGAPRAQAPRPQGGRAQPRREAGAVSVFRSPGVGLFAPSQRGLSPRGNPRSRHRTRLEVAWDGPGPPDSAPDPSISLSILRSIFDILPWLRRGKKGQKVPPIFVCSWSEKAPDATSPLPFVPSGCVPAKKSCFLWKDRTPKRQISCFPSRKSLTNRRRIAGR